MRARVHRFLMSYSCNKTYNQFNMQTNKNQNYISVRERKPWKKNGLPTTAKFYKCLPVEYTVTCGCKKRCDVRCKCNWMEVECSEFCANFKFYMLITSSFMIRDKQLLLFIRWKIIISIWLFFIQSKVGSCLLNGMKKEWNRFITLAFW